MTDYQKYINALRKCAKEHGKDTTYTGHIVVSDLCQDTANLLETLEQEPTTKDNLGIDAISREDALMCLTGKFEIREYEPSELISIFSKRIKELPSVTPQEPRWISVSERLPEDRRSVLVTAYWHETYQVMMASYSGDGLWWCVPFNNCGEHMQRLKPKAWMPLPKPYKAEMEDKK